MEKNGIAGQPPFEMNSFRRNDFCKPEPLKKQEMPRTLALVGSANRELYTLALQYDVTKRISAQDWLAKLDSYKLIDQ
jgi:hypothetical protein